LKVQFEFSIADLADVARRAGDRSQVIRDWRWQARATWAGLLCLALFFALDGGLLVRAIYSILIGIVLLAIYQRLWGSSPDGRLLRYYREQMGGDGPFICEVELSPQSVTTRQCGTETTRPWSSVADIVDTPDALEFAWRGGGLLVVRDRAFQSPQQRSEFLSAARGFLADARDGAQ
jgi:hypothetical protein